jgi:hypothetical protein
MELWDRCEIEACLSVAKMMIDRGHTFQAERIYKTLLQQAETMDGEGPLTGLVLLDLHEFYEKQGRLDEAAPAWERIRRILLSGFSLWTVAES